MKKNFNLREVIESDWEILLEWRNDKLTRQYSFNSELISINTHKEFIKNAIKNSNISLLILEYNGTPIGTIRENKLGKNEYELSYTISPLYRGKKIGQIMMSLYLIEQTGSFFCEVKELNFVSIKMIEKLGFKIYKTEKKVNFYKLHQGEK